MNFDWFDRNWEIALFVVGVAAIVFAIWRQHRSTPETAGVAPVKSGATRMAFWSNWFKPSASPASAAENGALTQQIAAQDKRIAELIRLLHQSQPAIPTLTDPVIPAPTIAAETLPPAAAPATPPAAPASIDGATWPRTVTVNGHAILCNSPAELREYAIALKE